MYRLPEQQNYVETPYIGQQLLITDLRHLRATMQMNWVSAVWSLSLAAFRLPLQASLSSEKLHTTDIRKHYFKCNF